MKNNQTIVKVNAEHSISILTLEDATFEVAHMVNGDLSYTIWNDVRTFSDSTSLQEAVQDLVAELVQAELDSKGFDATLEVEGQVVVETFTYNVWVACCFYNGELSFELSTQRDDDKDGEYTDRNRVERKTWKGLMNYLKRFDV